VSTNYGEKERLFLDSLKADTGRDLADWMSAIAAEKLEHRNDIIDWLRRQGFMFSKASWLERIHHNGGQPIYAGRNESKGERIRRSSAPRPLREAPAQRVAEAPVAPPVSQADATALDALLAKAKALRPLAQFVLREIAKAVPDALFQPAPAYVAISREREFAVLVIGPRELRLGLALGTTRPVDALAQSAKFGLSARISPAITHMIALDDARQVTGELLALVKDAAAASGS
jgi:hypothetical protein